MWFKSKLQNPDPEVRRQHLEHLEPQDDLLIEMARTDPHPAVRAGALTRIIDLGTLSDLATADADEGVRTQATARLQTLLIGGDKSDLPLDSRLGYLQSAKDQRLARFVVRSGHEPELRKSALQQLLQHKNDAAVQDLLCVVAAEDAVQEIRQAAAEPITDVKRLQLLLEKSRDKDKSIHRLARERLDEIEKQRKAGETLENCCLEIEQLNDHHFSPDGKAEEARLTRIVTEWESAATQIATVNKKLEAGFAAARRSINSQLADIAEQLRKRGEIIDALRLHLGDTEGEPVAELIKRWHDLDEASPQQAREFAGLITEVTEHDSQRDRDNHRIVAKKGLLRKMEQAVTADRLGKTALERLEERWQSAPDPDDEAQKTELHEQFLSLREKLRARLEKQQRLLAEGVAKISVLLDEYETALEEGKLQKVSSAHDKIVHGLTQLDAPQEAKHVLAKRLRAGEPRMGELKQWRHWGTEKKREELCEHIEQLALDQLKVPVIAKTVRESRDAWKALDKSDGPGSRKMWRRFDAACEKAYAPCQAHFDEQKAQRKDNMTRRVAICTVLEELHSATDWDSPDWRELSDKMRETEKSWHKAGSVDRRERNTIQSRYEKARAAIDEHLTARRLHEIERREALISEVEALAETDDTVKAINTAKRAQREWRPVVQSGRRKEQDLWKRFRAACDAVFASQKEQYAAADKERELHLGEKLAVCGQIEEVASQLKTAVEAGTAAADDLSGARSKVRELTTGWHRIGQVPRNKQQTVEKQFRKACKEVDLLCGGLEKQLQKQARAALRNAVSSCDQLEFAVADGQDIDLAAVEQISASLENQSASSSLAQRLKRLQAVANGDESARKKISDALPGNLDIRRTLCLEMEIAANIDSPDEFSNDRMQYRVKMLSESMSGTRQTKTPAQLEKLWYEAGPVAEADREKLDQRFNRALEALGSD